MALHQIHLHKLLKLLFLESKNRRSAILRDIREDAAREKRVDDSGGDFYGPFWRDAKDHALGKSDLHAMVKQRIADLATRSRLYPLLRDGFLLWWNERRRWTNLPFTQGRWLKAHYRFEEIQATVKVENILCVRDGRQVEHVVYPYFWEEPILTEDAARLGLWLLTTALPDTASEEIRILDVIRGQTFSLDRYPLRGDEEKELRTRYKAILEERKALLIEHAA
jgi:hypothetical protein